MGKQKGSFRIGTSGYQYNHWKGVFYPEECKKSEWFEHYSSVFDTVEINNTFYRLPEEETFEDWRKSAPTGFVYAVKFSRYGSHIKKLKDPADTIGLFVERASRLKGNLGPILVQLPPGWSVNAERLEEFLKVCPKEYSWTVEFRNPSWLCDEVFDLLRKHKTPLCIHDMIEDHPEILTSDWTYLRFHGPGDGGKYTYQYLSAQAEKINDWLEDGIDVFAYFNNDAHGHAVADALKLKGYLSQSK